MDKRLYYIDHIRVFLTILVIIHHTAIAYGAGGSWIYEDVDKSELTISSILLTIFTAINQSFFMGFFFFISGYFTPRSYDRKGWKPFFIDRLIRLGIPLLTYVFILGPIITYLAHYRGTISLVDYYLEKVITLERIHIGPLWFVEALICFNGLYILFRVLNNGKTGSKIKVPTTSSLLVTAIGLGSIAFLVRLIYPVGKDWVGLQFGYFPSYILLFIVGIIAYRQQWLGSINENTVRTWKIISLCSIPVLPLALIAGGALEGNLHFEGGMNVQSFVYSFWEPFVAFGIILWILQYFERKVNQHSPCRNMLSSTAYTVFIIHPVIVVGLSLILSHFYLFPTIKFLIVSISGNILCFALSALIIRIPYAKRVL